MAHERLKLDALPLVVDRKGLAALLKRSVTTIDRWDAVGTLGPVAARPQRGIALWGLDEVSAWVNEGMPKRDQWVKTWPRIRNARRN